MTESWSEFVFPVPAAGIELVASELHALGCSGLNVEEKQLDTFIPPDPDRDLPDAYMVKVYFPADRDPEETACRIRDSLEMLQPFVPGLVAVAPGYRRLEQQDWASGWKQFFHAERFGEHLVVRPSWEEYTGKPGDVVVELDPGMAFGTGSHETTRLCLRELARLYDRGEGRGTVLDVGTGSGILAIAAAALGAARVTAVDIEAEAVRVASENAELNGVGDRIDISQRDLAELAGGFEIVVANILAEENVRLAEKLVDKLAPGGHLLLSGILLDREPFVREGFAAFDLSGPEVTVENEWCCLHYTRGDGNG